MATDDLTAEQPQTLSVLPGELWLPVVGYEGLYEVSSLGRVKCCAKKLRTWYGERRSRERFLKKKLNSQTGYVKLVLQRDRKLKHTNVHVHIFWLHHKAKLSSYLLKKVGVEPQACVIPKTISIASVSI